MPSPDLIFQAGNMIALVGWAVLIFLPRRFKAVFLVPQMLIPVLLSLAYAALIATSIGQGPAEGDFSTIAGVRALFASDAVLTAGWLHYLAFDLFVGAWIAREADAIGLSRLIQPLFLIATFMLGPVGFLLFVATRAAMAGARRR